MPLDRSLARLALTGLFVTSLVAAQPPADLQLVDQGWFFDSPVFVRSAADGSGRLFVGELGGELLVVDGGVVQPTPFLDLTAIVDLNGEAGLLGMAFDPDFPGNGHFYVSYTGPGSGGDALTSVIERYTVSAGDPNVADPSSGVGIFSLGQPFGNHNGGDIHFGPDGYLYIGLGDGGDSAPAQDPADLLGKFLRIEPTGLAPRAAERGPIVGRCGQGAYAIPTDNPFVGDPTTCDEIWSLGWRNPFRWSFDRQTGDLWVGDVGESSREEVSFEPAASGGLNYGWNCREGDLPGPGGCSGTFVDPVMWYGHSAPCASISGGYRYRGCIEGLRGTYVAGDFCSGRVYFGTEATPGNWSISEWADLSDFGVYGFGEDEEGELYLIDSGSIYRFESASDCVTGEVFADGFETGDTTSWTSPGF